MDASSSDVKYDCDNGLCTSDNSLSVRIHNGSLSNIEPRDDVELTQTQPTTMFGSQPQVQDVSDSENTEQEEDEALKNQRTAAFAETAKTLRERAILERQLLTAKRKQQDGALYRFLMERYSRLKTSQSMVKTSDVRARAAQGAIEVASNDEYHDTVLKHAASDVDANIISTLFENVDMKLHGVRLFVKLLYGTFDVLPLPETLEAHFRIAHQLAMECFPNLNDEHKYAVTRQWTPRLKFNNVARTDKLPMARQSTAMVWPHIVIKDPTELATFWTTLDMRLTSSNPEYSNPVDVSALTHHTSRAKLQTVFSHKTIPCRACQIPVEGLAEYESSDEENQMRPKLDPHANKRHIKTPIPCECANTRVRIQEGSVQPMCELRMDNTTHPPHIRILRWNSSFSSSNGHVYGQLAQTLTSYEMLALHSIIPTESDFKQLHKLRFHVPVDAPKAGDPTGFNPSHKQHSPFGRDVLCTMDDNPFHKKLLKLRTTVRMKSSEHTQLYKLCTELIRKVGAPVTPTLHNFAFKREVPNDSKSQDEKNNNNHPYAHTVVHDIVCNTAKRRLYVNVQGQGSRFCFLNGCDHDPAVRVYFTISLDTFHVNAFCNAKSCQKTITDYFEWVHAKKDSKKKKPVEPDIPDAAMTLLTTKMQYVIAIEGSTRANLLLLALNKHYTGPSEQTLTLGSGPREPILQSQFSLGATGSRSSDAMDEDEEDAQEMVFDSEVSSYLPLRLHDSSVEDKLAFLREKHEKKKRKHKKEQDVHETRYLSFVDTISGQPQDKYTVTHDAMTAWKQAPSKFLC